MSNKIYMFQEIDEENEIRFWVTFEDFFECVKEAKGKEIFEATPKSIGHYEMQSRAVRTKSPKKKVVKNGT